MAKPEKVLPHVKTLEDQSRLLMLYLPPVVQCYRQLELAFQNFREIACPGDCNPSDNEILFREHQLVISEFLEGATKVNNAAKRLRQEAEEIITKREEGK